MGAVVPTRRWVEQALALAAVFSAALLSAPAACLLPCLVSRVSSPGCSAQCLLWARPSAGVLPSNVQSSHSCCPALCSELSFPIRIPTLWDPAHRILFSAEVDKKYQKLDLGSQSPQDVLMNFELIP